MEELMNEKIKQLLLDDLDRVSSEWATRGAPLPNGALYAMLTGAIINFAEKRLNWNLYMIAELTDRLNNVLAGQFKSGKMSQLGEIRELLIAEIDKVERELTPPPPRKIGF
jgi:hypothetical protein